MRRRVRETRMGQVIFFSPTHPFLPYVAPHFSHISHFLILFFQSQTARTVPKASIAKNQPCACLHGSNHSSSDSRLVVISRREVWREVT